ncbi:YihY/virulence factor BrkB family protein [Candidatus Nomurabacteria bacterium]|jgi:membrane protein|nr:MAG: YihY/virulence factor BrkB family protein [Candidatus Nomurabacteria bacterium]
MEPITTITPPNKKVFNYKQLVKKTLVHWSSHKPGRMSAALSYYAAFSIVPLFIVILSFASFFFNQAIVEASLLSYLTHAVGEKTATFISSVMTAATSNTTFVGIAISFVSIILGVTALLNSLYTSLDILWDTKTVITKTHNKRNIFKELKNHFLVLALLPLLGLFVTAAILANIFFSILGKIVVVGAISLTAYQVAGYILSILLLACFFAAIYRIVPKEKFSWGAILRGSVVTAILFIFGELLISFFIAHFANISLYGVVGSFIALLLWLFYSAQIFFIGASCTYVLDKYMTTR